ncbi:ArsA family ATPase [Demetria terragena]|uniref:ArsA family ATPase n=1 Tax=Demetria terragena TaxID=63959 RepID=UPI0004782C6E|nr:hypothetical protein [Demetria terragena]
MTSTHRSTAPRLVLLGGPGGVGTSAACADFADHYARAGQQVAVADLDPWNGASSRLQGTSVEVVTSSAEGMARPAGRLLDRVGLDPRLASELVVSPGSGYLELIHRLGMLTERTDLDVVLVDVGCHIVDVVSTADRLPWLVTHLLRAQRGWLSSARPRAATRLSWWPGADTHAQMQRVLDRVVGWAGDLSAAQAYLVGEESDPRTRRLRLGLALHELGAPSVTGGASLLPEPAPRSAATMVERDTGWAWRLTVPGLRSHEVRVDRSGDDLAVEVLGMRRLVTLPSALRRFRTAGARVSADHLEISFVPKESTK